MLRQLGVQEESASLEVARGLGEEVDRVAAFMPRVARIAPWRTPCMAQSLGAYLLLRRRRVPCTLYIGLIRDGSTALPHAWLRTADRIVTGGSLTGALYPMRSITWTPPRNERAGR